MFMDLKNSWKDRGPWYFHCISDIPVCNWWRRLTPEFTIKIETRKKTQLGNVICNNKGANNFAVVTVAAVKNVLNKAQRQQNSPGLGVWDEDKTLIRDTEKLFQVHQALMKCEVGFRPAFRCRQQPGETQCLDQKSSKIWLFGLSSSSSFQFNLNPRLQGRMDWNWMGGKNLVFMVPWLPTAAFCTVWSWLNEMLSLLAPLRL